ncbi:MAG: acetate kinase, partial [Synechococcaceae bacterium WBB_10_009]|nr:acetate kinase [Synechococcaceae bacterium WBB_10_009]
MAVLVLNVGSSSLKAALLQGSERLWSAAADRRGRPLPEQLQAWL